MNVEILRGKREGSYLYHCGDGYQYHFNKGNGYNEFPSTIWYLRCRHYSKRGCTGAAQINNPHGGNVQWTNTKRHTCAPNNNHPMFLNLRHEILNEAVNQFGPYETPTELVRRVRSRYPPNVAALVTGNHMRSSIRRRRMKVYPPVPQSLYHLGEVLADNMHITRGLDGVDSIYAGSVLGPNGTCSVIFSSRRMRRYMRRCKTVFCDGTFGSKPQAPQCAQVLQIVGVVGNSCIPLAQILTTGKTQAEYVAALGQLRQLVPQFRPRLVVTDYEQGLQNAWRQVFNVHVTGCYWHFCRAVSLTAKHDLGLLRLLRINRVMRSIVRASLAVPLLPQNLMARGLRTLIIEAHRAGFLDPLVPFFNYWIDTWMSPAHMRSLSVFGIRHRTNNIAESSNRLLRSLTGVHHPNIWHFLMALRRYDSDARLNLRRINMGLPISRKRKISAINNDRRIQNLTLNVMRGHISINRFLHLASTRVMRVFDHFVG